MEFRELDLKGAFLIELTPFNDDRGSFTRLFCSNELEMKGLESKIVQVNHSQSLSKGTLRGLHYQKTPFNEVKIVQCVRGKIYDVIVDLRYNSPTFLKWYGVNLTDEDHRALYIPSGFAHGYITLEDNSEIMYFVTNFYNPKYEAGLKYNDPTLGIQWPIDIRKISEKDNNLPYIQNNFKGLDI